jgi:predicted alpha/beta-hydrolase family hydrolase
MSNALAAAGFTVLRFDLPFRQLRPHGPPHPGSAARDRDGLRRAIAVTKEKVKGRVFLGGHSYGGRQASMLLAEEPQLAEGLFLLSYPLHPPKKPTELRTQHFPKLSKPVFFVHGTRDPFGSTAEIEQALKMIPARTKLFPFEGAGHDLGFKGKTRREDLPKDVLSEFEMFFR